MTPVQGPFCPHCKQEDAAMGRHLRSLHHRNDHLMETIHILSGALLKAAPDAWQATMRRFDTPQPATGAAGGEAGRP